MVAKGNGVNRPKSQRLRVGDHVWVPMGRGKTRSLVVEDRGNIGFGGRQLVRVRVPMDPYEPNFVERGAEDLELADEPPAAPAKEEVVGYLKRAGLLSMLRAESEVQQPRVWLCPNSLGDVTHTFYQDHGVLGGQPVPARALLGRKIHEPRRADVVSFLRGFGLSKDEADEVIDAVGVTR